jgi:hypothetical protein
MEVAKWSWTIVNCCDQAFSDLASSDAFQEYASFERRSLASTMPAVQLRHIHFFVE